MAGVVRQLEIVRIRSGADETGVEGAGEGDVRGALDDGAAVGEEGEGVRRTFEAKEKAVEADVSVGDEAVAHGGKVDGAVMLVDLDGVASAEGDVGAAFPCQMREATLSADGAVGIRGGGVHFAVVIAPEIVGEEGAAHQVGLAGKELEGFGDLDGGGEVDGGGKDAGGVAGFDGAGGWLGEDAGKAGGGRQGVGRRRESAGVWGGCSWWRRRRRWRRRRSRVWIAGWRSR